MAMREFDRGGGVEVDFAECMVYRLVVVPSSCQHDRFFFSFMVSYRDTYQDLHRCLHHRGHMHYYKSIFPRQTVST